MKLGKALGIDNNTTDLKAAGRTIHKAIARLFK